MQNTIKQRFDLQYMAHIMNTTYRHTKQVTRELEGSTHTLPILFEYAWSMLRVCLEYAYSMPRVCLEYAYTHLIRNPYAISVRARRTASPLLTDRESAPYGLFLTLLLLISGVVGSWGQTDYSGTYFIGTVNQTDGFYLCPTDDDYIFYNPQNDTYTTDKTYKENAFITTYKCKNTTEYSSSDALWIIEKHPNQNYYYIIHASDKKYLTYNKAFFSSNKGRVRVHLEGSLANDGNDANDDYQLFKIEYKPAWNSYDIISKYAEDYTIDPDDKGNPRKYLNINKGNKQSLEGDGDAFDGIKTGGIIGLWTAGSSETQGTGRFFLEDYITRPNIAYNSSNLIEITAAQTGEGITIKYTTDGKTPTSEYGETYSGPFDPPANTTTIKAIAIVNGKESNVATFTPQFLLGPTHKYIIQSKNCKFYNMIPNTSVDANTNYVSTLNVPTPTMAWHLEYAEEGYYYIVDVNGWYMYYTTTGNTNKYIYLKSSKDESAGFKFSITAHTNGGYSIIPKGQTKPIYKNNYGGSDAGLKPVKYDGTLGNAEARWDIIPYSSSKLPMWEVAPFDEQYLSTDDNTYYFQIVSVQVPEKCFTLNISGETREINSLVPSGTEAERNKSLWTIKKVGTEEDNDDWLEFYTFQNAFTGELLYYNGNGRNYNGAVLQMGQPTKEGANATWSHFVIVQTANGYNIIPRSIVDNTKAIDRNSNNEGFNCINRRGGGDALGTFYDDSDGSRWTFAQQTNVKCMNPIFTEETDGSITITSVTPSAKIRYTVNGVDPDENSDEYTTKLNTSEKKVIKAIAIMGNDASSASNVVTLLNNPDITLSQDTYTYDGTAKQPAVNEVSIGEAPNKTTATAGTDFETVIATDYSNNTNAGTAKVTLRDKASNVYVWHAEKEFTINKKDLTATADDKTISYGDDVPTYTISYTGFENSEDASAVTTPPTITCAYTSTSDVNTYTISVNTDGVATNYNIIPGTPGKLTVNQREVVLSWGTTPIIYNGTAQAPTATATNLKNEDVIGVTVDGAQTNAGDYTATASALTGDKKDNYKLPTANTQDFTIGKRPVTISGITASDKEYDGTTAATLVLTGATFADGDIIGTDNVTIESATGAFDDANAGTGKTVTISAITLGGTSVANYEFAGSSQQTEITANITKAPLTVTADNQNVTYGDAAPTYTITYAGWKNGEEKTVLTTEPTASSEYTQGSNAGSYPIIVTGGIATNYDITPQNGTLTVGPKTLTQDNISFGEGGIVVVKDGETTLTEGTDYTIGEEQHSGINNKYTVTPVIGKNDGTSSGTGNYTGTVSIRHANVHLTTGANQANYSATFVAESAGDADIGHVLPEGFTAYIISGIEGSWAIPEPMEYIPAGVPVLLVAHEEKTGFLVRDAKSADVSDISAQKSYNKLKEVTAESAHFNTRQIYVLYKNEFVLNKEGDLAKGKVYMENPKYVAPSSPSSPAPASLSIAWGNVTGIEDGRWKMDDGRSDRWYTLDGRCLIGKPTAKGLYIVNGKKRVVK